ncbi:uncharacterized protein C2845_PM08G00460 [Panicum miliaceum]|uniref:TF-B3 domain-containing protein n=1 Tax=Panicum miliaceum TaxID=4540 RepID=A0A3L6QVF4_PANMI|nr:uncharacterized protein C2845_PM08G00460 [Panicum miliaceum]
MGAPKPPVFFWPPSASAWPPTSPPSKTPALPPPPPLPPGFFPSSFSPLPLPPPCGLLMPPPPPAGGFPYPGGSRSPKGGRFVEHLEHGGGVSVTAPARCVPAEGDLAGVPPELLPLKKRVVRYHPYAAAAAIQEMASHRNHGGGGFLLAVDVVPVPTTGARLDLDLDLGERDGGGLRAELLRLRIMRPALVLTKQLTFSDRSRDKARLLLPDGLVAPSPLLGMLTPAERRLVFGAGLPVPAFDRLGRAYRMSLRRDPKARTYRLTGQWSLFVSRHHTRAGDAVEVRAFRPSSWQARLDKHGEGGLGMALLHRRDDAQGYRWCNRERDAADGLLRMAASASPATAAVA